MNRKLVVAMSILGLVSCPVFAATSAKHKHHHKHQMVEAQHVYKDVLPEPVCTITQNARIMSDMSQDFGRAMPNPCNPGWFNRLTFTGGVNVDLGKFGNRNANFMGVNYQRFSLNDAYLNVGATINDWVKAFASLSYSTATINPPDTMLGGVPNAEYSAAYSNNVTAGGSSTVQLEQAYATVANFDASPLFLQVGKKFQDFSRYEIHPITRSLTQVMSETLATSLNVGFVANGFNGTLYAFDDPMGKVGKTSTTTNYGIGLGYAAPADDLGWDIGVGYLYNLIGVNDIAYVVNQFNQVSGRAQGYNSRIGGAAAYFDLNSGPFMVGLRYTTAVQRFSMLDAPKNFMATSTTGAKPWAAGIQAGYGFEAWGKSQNIYLGYQTSREAASLLLPKYRYLVGYGVDLFGKNTTVAIEWDHDKAFSTSNGGNGSSYNLVTIRTGFKFG
jgi:hypothetical protein